MRKLLLTLLILTCAIAMHAADLSTMQWKNVCAGKMGEDWYGSDEAKNVADVVLYVQKTNGGWMKNDQLHILTDDQKEQLHNERGTHSCLDNGATTQEIRFLAKVYNHTGDDTYLQGLLKGVNMILASQKQCGGWSQYWPLSGNGSYQDYITFNDDLMTNALKLMRDLRDGTGDFAIITTPELSEKCGQAFDRGITTILLCQIDDNGTPAAWCAQHDTITFLPTEGRPHELPSVSGSESASLLSFLMTIENPSPELKNCISTAVAWLDAHSIPDKAVQNFVNDQGEDDVRVIDMPGSAIWGRFIQIGGESGKIVYDHFFDMLKQRGKTRSYTYEGKTYTYTEYEMATSSYDPSKAYEPIYSIYDSSLPYLYYRFLYNFEDTPPVKDSKGLPIATSLNAKRRTNYQYLGSWPMEVIRTQYPAWQDRVESLDDTLTAYVLSSGTYKDSKTEGNLVTYNFTSGISVTNNSGKGYGAGTTSTSTVKYSAGVDYTIQLPAGMKVTRIKFYGYNNYDDKDSYISKCNGQSYASTMYPFPKKAADGSAVLTTHSIDFYPIPAQNTIPFRIEGKQCCLVITLYKTDGTTSIVTLTPDAPADTPIYSLDGTRLTPTTLRPGQIYIRSGQKFLHH